MPLVTFSLDDASFKIGHPVTPANLLNLRDTDWYYHMWLVGI